jgi:F0F1-type ATP synthase membrane subunit b/b'
MHIPPDWSVFGTLLVSFLAFWVIFGWLFFGPFLKLLSERERRINDLNERTARLLQEAKSAVEERERQLAVVRREALVRRDTERRRAEGEAAKMIEETRAEARAELDRVGAALDQEIQAAHGQLQEMARKLGAELAGRVLGRQIDDGGAANN